MVDNENQRIADLNASVIAIGARTVAAGDSNGQSDRALAMLALNNEILSLKGTRTNK